MLLSPTETRTVTTTFELRDGDAAPTLVGYASTFSQPYDLGPFREQIAPGAFNRTLANGPDVRLLVDHDGQPLARTKSGTLTLEPDAQGLRVHATLDPSDPDVQRLLPKMRRGDLDQMSFAFRVPKGGDTWEQDYTLRTITEASLADGDVSVVTYPANPNTTAAVRAEDLTEARCVFVDALVAEIRAGRTVSEANVAKLNDVLRALTGTEQAVVDEAREALAEVTAPIGMPLGLALAKATRLRIG